MALKFVRLQEENIVQIQVDEALLEANLVLPSQASALVIFAHGSGSSRNSVRNRFIAEYLNRSGLATLLMDLLTSQEKQADLFSRDLRFDINLMTARISAAIDCVASTPSTSGLKIGLFGSSTGAAGALMAAAQRPEQVCAVVSRGGRTDLASQVLASIQAPTLMIVGAYDIPVIDINQSSYELIKAEKCLEIVPGATHLFEEPGTLEEVAHLTQDWFQKYIG